MYHQTRLVLLHLHLAMSLRTLFGTTMVFLLEYCYCRFSPLSWIAILIPEMHATVHRVHVAASAPTNMPLRRRHTTPVFILP